MSVAGHAESYNPSPEYIPTEEEVKAWQLLDPEDRPLNFIPKKYVVCAQKHAQPQLQTHTQPTHTHRYWHGTVTGRDTATGTLVTC